MTQPHAPRCSRQREAPVAEMTGGKFRVPSEQGESRRTRTEEGGQLAQGGGQRSDVMGNSGSLELLRRGSGRGSRRGSRSRRDVPQITVIQASPLPQDGSVFVLPGPEEPQGPEVEPEGPQGPVEPQEPEGPAEAEPGGSQQSLLSTEDQEDASSSEGGCSPRASREHFLQVMMRRSPDVRRSLVLRSAGEAPRTDLDSQDEERLAVTLDPLEHEWMLCASDGEWAGLQRLLAAEPGLLLKKDFVSGFTCLHWAAKHNNPEMMALIVNFAKQHRLPLAVDVRSNMGYTPLHLAAIHGHMEVVKLLVGAYGADVDARDYSGRKACQYLTHDAGADIRDIVGDYELSVSEGAEPKEGGRWRFSKALQNMDGEAAGAEGRLRVKPLRRRSSLSRMKPNLQKIRLRASHIVHRASFRDPDGPQGRPPRPKTHFLG
ncbi:PREDICTED: ankyrin repeat domain-containing protein SOWAHC-like [Cyprinodon variegatus]|uniref:ankyrin repeat domain-containing protein SOWAHC-like n=1 Tax=Cyprinodon variegatus TaxID=28743 RepID=UPI0007427B32|nr:PREDICTED: ankyrin repeat domain-containing protein SOWAHC-like [Cyprinodon variegatus]